MIAQIITGFVGVLVLSSVAAGFLYCIECIKEQNDLEIFSKFFSDQKSNGQEPIFWRRGDNHALTNLSAMPSFMANEISLHESMKMGNSHIFYICFSDGKKCAFFSEIALRKALNCLRVCGFELEEIVV